ncbi:MAG: hypothetical protein Tp172MES00d2C118482111_3 [Prokaryotic dsDNA virus sp.]|nr:MAG: hypothetical protein Tp172MES00d2C118482111_3 [Prokaryotic dsDNA virus sp.]|tara:strand:- start:14883 stop:15527 length:645 start_codon:yes stop_codon:yes gene_type:complete
MTFNIKQISAFAVGLIIIPILSIPSTTVYVKKAEPPAEPDDESAILSAPEPQISATSTDSTTATTTEPEPTNLPEGVYCLEDCPLIVPDQVNAGVEETVRDFFKDIPVMIAIARCESTFKQWDSRTGDVLMNSEGSSATGVMQLMASYHARPAEILGMDIEELEGNLQYARVLYNERGTQPWDASKKCWGSANMAINNDISDTISHSPTLAMSP